MKGKKCPYCGRRISYLTVFHEKKHGVYECSRCKKESKIKISKMMIISFCILVFFIVLYVIFWRNSGFYNNILGVIPPVILLVVFYYCTPFFIKFVPLKSFLSHEDTVQKTEQIEEKPEEFVFDKKVFDEIKNKRSGKTSVEERIDRIIEEEESYVPVIEDVSEGHISSQAPVRKINRPSLEDNYDEDMESDVNNEEKSDGTRYSANRKF